MIPEHYAIEILKDLGINTLPVNPYKIAKEFDIEVTEADTDNIEGCLLRIGQNTGIIINKNIENTGRKNFTIAHELGHYTIPSHRGVYICNTEHLNLFGKNTAIENEANKFASELLLPEFLLNPLVDKYKPDFEDISDLATDCDTSLTATTTKYVSLTSECCALIVSSNKRIKWARRSSSFNFFIENDHPVANGTLTASCFSNGISQAATWQKTPANLWVDSKGIDRNTELIESCLPIPKYAIVLTMLWFDEFDIDKYEDDREYRYEEDNWKWRDPD